MEAARRQRQEAKGRPLPESRVPVSESFVGGITSTRRRPFTSPDNNLAREHRANKRWTCWQERIGMDLTVA